MVVKNVNRKRQRATQKIRTQTHKYRLKLNASVFIVQKNAKKRTASIHCVQNP